MKTLHQLERLRTRWEKATIKDESRRTDAINSINVEIVKRTLYVNQRALPKKKQREMGILPPVNSAI